MRDEANMAKCEHLLWKLDNHCPVLSTFLYTWKFQVEKSAQKAKIEYDHHCQLRKLV